MCAQMMAWQPCQLGHPIPPSSKNKLASQLRLLRERSPGRQPSNTLSDPAGLTDLRHASGTYFLGMFFFYLTLCFGFYAEVLMRSTHHSLNVVVSKQEHCIPCSLPEQTESTKNADLSFSPTSSLCVVSAEHNYIVKVIETFKVHTLRWRSRACAM